MLLGKNRRFARFLFRLSVYGGLFLLLCGSDCDPDCPDMEGNYVTISVYDKQTRQPIGLNVYESALELERGVTMQQPLTLLLDVQNKTSTFVLTTRQGNEMDTLRFTHNAEMDYHSSDCGMQFIVHHLSVDAGPLETELRLEKEELGIWTLNIYR
jgi:hypothetical protein